VGAVLGALVAPSLQRRIPAPVVLLGALWAWAAQMSVLAVLPDVMAIGAVLGLGALVAPLFNVVVAGYRYALAPDRLMARTLSAARLVAWGTIPLASLAAGLLLQSLGAVPTIVLLAGLMTVVAAVAAAARTIRRAPPAEALVPSGTPATPALTPR
jgi:hypothetical protein